MGRLSLLRQDVGTARSGSAPRLCKRPYRYWSRMRTSLGHVFRRRAYGAIRMAPLLHRSRSHEHGLAHSLAQMGSASRHSDFARGKGGPWVFRTLEAALGLGDLRWPFWRKLRALLCAHLP